jgi:hypothetical protein
MPRRNVMLYTNCGLTIESEEYEWEMPTCVRCVVAKPPERWI